MPEPDRLNFQSEKIFEGRIGDILDRQSNLRVVWFWRTNDDDQKERAKARIASQFGL
jgi:hypothetical protein